MDHAGHRLCRFFHRRLCRGSVVYALGAAKGFRRLRRVPHRSGLGCPLVGQSPDGVAQRVSRNPVRHGPTGSGWHQRGLVTRRVLGNKVVEAAWLSGIIILLWRTAYALMKYFSAAFTPTSNRRFNELVG